MSGASRDFPTSGFNEERSRPAGDSERDRPAPFPGRAARNNTFRANGPFTYGILETSVRSLLLFGPRTLTPPQFRVSAFDP